MASPTSGPKPIPLADFAADVERRRVAAGLTDGDIPRNAGTRRTPSKRALLRALDDLGAKW